MSRFDPRRSWPAFLVAAGGVIAVVFAALEPGPSRGLAGLERRLFWLPHAYLPLIFAQTAQIGMSRIAPLVRIEHWALIVAAGGVAAAAFTPFALALDGLFPVAAALKDGDEDGGYWDELASLAPLVTLIWTALNGVRFLRFGGEVATPPAADAAAPAMSPDTEAAAAFWRRTPRRLGRDLVSLSAELRYVRVVTTLGEDFVLRPFGRALEAMADAPGLRINRSHWMALAHVAGVEREGERVTCRLSTGGALPVSRPYRRALRDAVAAQSAPAATS